MKKETDQVKSVNPVKKKAAAQTTGYELPEGYVLCLRSNNEDNQSYGDFQWPESGECIAPDWSSKKVCGQGLHGMLWGMGEHCLLNWESGAKWLVVEVLTKSIIDLKGKVKFPRGRVIFSGDRLGATNLITKFAPVGTLVIGGTSTSGDCGTSTSGDYGTSTSGYYGTSTSGYRGTSTSGYRGTSTSGYRGTSTSGDCGTSTSGYRGTSTSGDCGTSTSGYYGTSTSGYRGILNLAWWDSKAQRRRIVMKYVGEDGIKANTPYTIDGDGNVSEVPS